MIELLSGREHGAMADDAKVVQSFVRDGRLVSIPARAAKRRVVLDVIAQDFEPGLRYPEVKVNDLLRRWHPDVAAIRRHLVDGGFLEREGGGGDYWRAGGTVELD